MQRLGFQMEKYPKDEDSKTHQELPSGIPDPVLSLVTSYLTVICPAIEPDSAAIQGNNLI